MSADIFQALLAMAHGNHPLYHTSFTVLATLPTLGRNDLVKHVAVMWLLDLSF